MVGFGLGQRGLGLVLNCCRLGISIRISPEEIDPNKVNIKRLKGLRKRPKIKDKTKIN